MNGSDWQAGFREVYDRAVSAYRSGATTVASCVNPADRAFLTTIGCSAQELFDFVEDDVVCGEPGFAVALAVTAIRREYFLEVDGGSPSTRVWRSSEFPARDARLGGIRWLPRIIAKARAKLRGGLPSDLMYGCGGDRAFLREHGLTADGFLRAVWESGKDDGRILEYVRQHARS